MKLGSDKRIRWWRFISSHLSALSFLEKRCKIVSERDGNECCWSPSSSSSFPSLFKSEQFCTQYWQHNHEQDWTMANYCAVENAVGGNRNPWKSHSRENPTEPRRRKSLYGMHIYNYRNNNSLLLALLSRLIRSTMEYHLKHPHYATLMQENTWSLAFTWLCDWNEGLLRLGIITRLFRAGGTACHGCSQISGRLWFGTANHRLIKLVPSPVCNPRRQFHCFISDTKLFCWCSILRY